jgi:hypothetical protein
VGGPGPDRDALILDRFTVTDDAAFLAAWASEPRDATLYRALRDDVQPRFAALPGPHAGGVLLIAPPDWPTFKGRQGCIDERVVPCHDGGTAKVVRWSSPLMYARATRDRALPGHAALYVPASM